VVSRMSRDSRKVGRDAGAKTRKREGERAKKLAESTEAPARPAVAWKRKRTYRKQF